MLTNYDAEDAWSFCQRQAQGQLLRKLKGERKMEAVQVLKHLKFQTSDRMTSTAGQAHLQKRLVVLSKPLFHETYVMAQVIDTILHEIAHHLAWHLDRDNGHGPAWIWWAELIGCSAERCHALPRARRKTKTAMAQAEAAALQSGLTL